MSKTRKNSKTSRHNGPFGTEAINKLEDIPFEQRVAIWALRSSLKGENGIKKVKLQFQRALPPSPARISIQSFDNIIESFRRHGHRSLYLNCMCKKTLSSDEKEILKIFDSISNNDKDIIRKSVNALVREEGFNLLVGGISGFLISMAARHDPKEKKASLETRPSYHEGSTALH